MAFILYIPFCFVDKGSLALQITYDYDIRDHGGMKYIFFRRSHIAIDMDSSAEGRQQ